LDDVAREFNAFCEGRHPLFPGVTLDGSDGGVDYRVKFEDQCGFGTFFRSEEQCALVLGSMEQPTAGQGLEFYEGKDVEITTGSLETIHQRLQRLTRKPGTIALRDYFPYWRSRGLGTDPDVPNGGKLMVLDPMLDPAAPHEVFFDDNIRMDATKIVDVRMRRMPSKNIWVQYLLPCHLVRAEPLQSVTNANYFVEHVTRLAASYEARLRTCVRLKALIQKAVCAGTFISAVTHDSSIADPEYDAWSEAKEMCRTISQADRDEGMECDDGQ